jgi:plasmid maintenance system antidote protein VapI
MGFTFEILGVSPVLEFFNYEQTILKQQPLGAVAYVGSYQCTLDALLSSVESVSPERSWELDPVINAVMTFWMNNDQRIRYWKQQLETTQEQSLVVARIANLKTLRLDFEKLFTT